MIVDIPTNTCRERAVRQIIGDKKGNLWIATEDGGLNYYNKKRKASNISNRNRQETVYHITTFTLYFSTKKIIYGSELIWVD